MMTISIVVICIALLLLFAGAEGLVRGSASLARRAGLSPLAIGLTIVAFGTSSPELVVSLKAALSQHGDIAVANVVGSNTFNIAVILGITALICPIPVHRQIIKLDAPVALAVTLLLVWLLADQLLGRFEGLLLLSGIIAYTLLNLVLARRQEFSDPAVPADEDKLTVSTHWAWDLLMIGVGLGVLIFGSNLLVEHATLMARELGISDAVIGLTIVAAGTSMPELATSLLAAIRRQPDIAIGNVIGSNVFNVLGILGITSLVAPLSAPGVSLIDYALMLFVTLLIIPLLYTGRMLHRLEGVLLLVVYGVYLWLLWPA